MKKEIVIIDTNDIFNAGSDSRATPHNVGHAHLRAKLSMDHRKSGEA